MATCKGCGMPFTWGNLNGKWVPLEPTETHSDLDRTYVDENGELRADHRDRHSGGASVNISRLDRKIPAEQVPDVDIDSSLVGRIAKRAKEAVGG
jgi:hypothetical protein